LLQGLVVLGGADGLGCCEPWGAGFLGGILVNANEDASFPFCEVKAEVE
jgi:hypothetical protein